MTRRRDLIQPFRLALRPLVTSGGRYAVGVSGGADSIALLDLAHRAAASLGLELVVVHLDHGWRSGSADDAALVEQAAAERGLPFVGERLEPARPTEAAGREARLSFFRRAAPRVLLGHTADDQSETVITHLLRGSGSLRGMQAAEEIDGLRVVRPLLGFRRADIRGYCADRRLTFVDDPSNRDPAFLRNRVRHELLPLLEEMAPGAAERLTRLAEITRGDLELIEAAVDAAWPGLVSGDPAGLSVDRPSFRRMPTGLQRAVLRRVGTVLLGPAPDLSLERVEAARLALLRGRGGAVVEWPTGARLELDGRRGIFRRYAT